MYASATHSWLWFNPDENTATAHGTVEFLAQFRNPPTDLDSWQRALGIGAGFAG